MLLEHFAAWTKSRGKLRHLLYEEVPKFCGGGDYFLLMKTSKRRRKLEVVRRTRKSDEKRRRNLREGEKKDHN